KDQLLYNCFTMLQSYLSQEEKEGYHGLQQTFNYQWSLRSYRTPWANPSLRIWWIQPRNLLYRPGLRRTAWLPWNTQSQRHLWRHHQRHVANHARPLLRHRQLALVPSWCPHQCSPRHAIQAHRSNPRNHRLLWHAPQTTVTTRIPTLPVRTTNLP